MDKMKPGYSVGSVFAVNTFPEIESDRENIPDLAHAARNSIIDMKGRLFVTDIRFCFSHILKSSKDS